MLEFGRHRVVPSNTGGGYTPVGTTLVWGKAPSTVNIGSLGGTDAVIGIVMDQNNNAMAVQPAITYTSGTPGNITVSGNTLTAVANGTSLITAASAGLTSITGTATVAQVLSSITVTPANPTVTNGTPQAFTAVGRDSGGSIKTLGAGTWSSSNPTQFPITVGGSVTPNVSSGTSIIKFTETSSGISGSTIITASASAATSVYGLLLVLNGRAA